MSEQVEVEREVALRFFKLPSMNGNCEKETDQLIVWYIVVLVGACRNCRFVVGSGRISNLLLKQV